MLENPLERKRTYAMQLGRQQAVCEIPAPHGKVAPEDAQDLLDWLALICGQLRRDIARGNAVKPVSPAELLGDPAGGVTMESAET